MVWSDVFGQKVTLVYVQHSVSMRMSAKIYIITRLVSSMLTQQTRVLNDGALPAFKIYEFEGLTFVFSHFVDYKSSGQHS